MLLSDEEIKQQTRDLWRTCFHDTEEFMDIYFSEKYTPQNNHTLRHDGRVISALQALPYRLTFSGAVMHAAYLSGVATLPEYRGLGNASHLLYETHRELFRRDTAISFLIPADEEAAKFYQHPDRGGYAHAVWRKELPIDTSADGTFDDITVERPDEWGDDLYVFYRRMTSDIPFMFHPSEHDFFAAVEALDLEDGYVLTAHYKGRLCGVCLAVKEPNGKVYMRSLALCYAEVRAAFVDYLCRECGVEKVYRRFCLPQTEEGVAPYAMARIINVERFLQILAAKDRKAHWHLGIQGDAHLPENNGFYYVENGKVYVTNVETKNVLTPGGLASLFFGNNSLVMDLMLDE